MKKLLLLALVLAGCAKANDVGRLEDEVAAVASDYAPVIHELENRANDLRKIGKLAPEADSRLRDATTQIQHMKGQLAGASNRADLDRMATQDPELVQKRTDNLQRDLAEGIMAATDHLQAVESWVAAEERHPNHGAQASAQTPGPAPTP